MKSKLFIFSVILELIVIGGLVVYIKNKKGQVIGKATYNPISKDEIASNPHSSLKHYYEPKKDSVDNLNPWIPYKATYTINNDTLNERYDYSTQKAPGTFRIVTLGDSWTYGLYVDTRDNWTERLEDMLNSNLNCKNIKKFEVINLGVQGYDLQYSVERFKLRGEKYNPDLVLWLLKGDDLVQINEIMLPLEKKIADEMHNSGEFEKELAQGINYPSWDKAYEEFSKGYPLNKILDIQAKNLDEFPTDYKNPLIIMTMPIDRQYSIEKFGEDLIFNFIDKRPNVKLYENFPDLFQYKGAQFPTDTHPNKKGHEIIANNLFEYLKSKDLINCQN